MLFFFSALRAERYECATSYYDINCDVYKKPKFGCSNIHEFKPSTNIAPTEVTPVLVWDAKEKAPVLRPMVWGLIPSWADVCILLKPFYGVIVYFY